MSAAGEPDGASAERAGCIREDNARVLQGLRGQHFAGGVFALALMVRLIAIGLAGPGTVRFGDGADYLHTAAVLCTTGAYPEAGNLPFFRAPGLPWFIALVTGCEPAKVARVKIALAVVDSATAVLVFWLAWFLSRRRIAGVIAGFAAALWPFFVAAVTDVRSEPLFMFFLTASLCLVLAFRESGRAIDLVAGGASVAAASLTRPAGLALAVVLALICGFFARRRGAAAALRSALIFSVACGLTLGPWVVRNYVRYGELILVNDAGGYNFWRGGASEMIALENASKDRFAPGSQDFETNVTRRLREEVEQNASSPMERSGEWAAIAERSIRSDPGSYIAFTRKKAARYWRPWLDPREHGAAEVVGSGIINFLLFLVAVEGLILLRPEQGDVVWTLVAFIVAGWLLHIPFQVVMRFRIPITDPLFLALGAVAMTELVRRIERRGRGGKLPVGFLE